MLRVGCKVECGETAIKGEIKAIKIGGYNDDWTTWDCQVDEETGLIRTWKGWQLRKVEEPKTCKEITTDSLLRSILELEKRIRVLESRGIERI